MRFNRLALVDLLLSPWAAILLLLVFCLAFAMTGCAGAPVQVEICVMHPTYGKICGSLVDGKVKITADAVLPPDVEREIQDHILELGNK